ncbi:hypothetical protein FAZ95_01485 [Trinickia violacea]|uniref:Transposase n=1 Tax=Trinickia violacea TaxID=2571746 RepID=A0A4P8III3_9BURK|nr:hypothetical protein FAZ95_01485 [Trinickia violacea]
MRGADGFTEAMFTMAKLDDFVPASHPLRPIRIWLKDARHQFDTNQTYAAALWKSVPRIGEVYFTSLPGHRQSIASTTIARASKCGRLLCVRIRHSNDRTRASTKVCFWPDSA